MSLREGQLDFRPLASSDEERLLLPPHIPYGEPTAPEQLENIEQLQLSGWLWQVWLPTSCPSLLKVSLVCTFLLRVPCSSRWSHDALANGRERYLVKISEEIVPFL